MSKKEIEYVEISWTITNWIIIIFVAVISLITIIESNTNRNVGELELAPSKDMSCIREVKYEDGYVEYFSWELGTPSRQHQPYKVSYHCEVTILYNEREYKHEKYGLHYPWGKGKVFFIRALNDNYIEIHENK